ncbi:lonely Cys domain-containing protein, partial [Streptomyces sp. WG7]|uniref:lonely Cys domain-containing protein n=1 Tax=Streptomyces sp. WG7 TaxID=3417650 RepID=UPI003CF929A0
HPVGVGDLWMLYDVAQEAWAAGRAGSVVAVAAFYLDRHLGVLSGPDYVAGPNGWVPGRNWLGGTIPLLDVDHGGYLGGPREVMKWAGEQPYVLLANGNPRGVQVADHRDGLHWVRAEELAELLRHDPVMPTDGPVVLFVDGAGAGGLELPRLVADRLGGENRVVWAPDGILAFEEDPHTDFTRLVLDDRRRARPVGKWIPSRPGYVRPPGAEPGFFRTVDGEVHSDRRVMWHTISRLDDAEIIGRSSLRPRATAEEERRLYPLLPSAEYWARVYPHRDAMGPLRALDGPQIGYWVVAHGNERAVTLRLDGGTEAKADYGQLGGLLRRRPSFQKLRADQAVQLHVCHAGSLAPGRDRLVVPRNGQMVANTVGRVVRAMPEKVGVTGVTYGSAVLAANPTDVPEVFPRLFFPEPSGRVLEGLVGRYLGGPDGVLPAQPEERMLRMMRAVNEIFGIDPASDPRLLEAFGRLEWMRLADEHYAGARGGPLTWELLEEIAGQYAQRQEAWQRSGVPSGWPLLRVMREMLGKALDPWAGNPMTLTWFLDNSSEVAAVRLPRALDPAFWNDGPPDTWQEIQMPAASPPVDSSVLRGTWVPEFVSPSENPVGREGWWSRREWAA